jgi:hypothetical protein
MAKRERGIHRLSAKDIEKKGDGLHPDGGGLYLQVRGNSRSWLFRVGGRAGWMGLGPTHTVNAAEARKRAEKIRLQRHDGIDPLAARKAAERDRRLAEAKNVSFKDCAGSWMKRNVHWTPARREQIKRRLEMYAYPAFENGELPIQKLDVRAENSFAVDLVLKAIGPLWRPKEEGGHFPTAQALRQDIEGILDHAWASDWIQGDALAMKSKLDVKLPPPEFHVVEHHRTFKSFKDIVPFMAKLRACVDNTGTLQAGSVVPRCQVCSHPRRDEIDADTRAHATLDARAEKYGINRNTIWAHYQNHAGRNLNTPRRPLSAYAIELIALTALRKGSVLKSEWNDIDWDDRLLIIPWKKHKVGKQTKDDLVVPLSDAAVTALRALKDWQDANGIKSDYVFPGGRGGKSGSHMSNTAVNNFLKGPLGRRDLTIHGFRTTFGQWSVEEGYEERDSEMALGHVVGNNVRNIYKRNVHRIEPRRLMMQAWADFCARGPLPADVIPLRAAKAK